MRETVYDTDQELVEAFRNAGEGAFKDVGEGAFKEGGRGAFTQVYERFHGSLFYFAQRFVSREEARDVVADAFVALWAQRANFDAVPKIERWLFNTVRYSCLALLRRQVRLETAKEELANGLEQAQFSDLLTEDLATDLVALLHREIARLPPRQREVFLLSFQEGLKPGEIARRLSLSVETVKKQKGSAIKFLQAVLGQRAVILALLVLLHEK